MGFSYLDGRTWAEVTREERFFCQRLFEAIRARGASRFVEFIEDRCTLGLNPDRDWEAAYEVCFYRDLFRLRDESAREAGLSAKRTFDLCLFSETAIVIVEAKAQGSFTGTQLKEIAADAVQVRRLTGAAVFLLSIASGGYEMKKGTRFVFDGVVRWNELAEFTGEPGEPDPVLLRADAIYGR